MPQESQQVAFLDLSVAEPGIHYLDLSPKNFDLPPGVSIRKITPTSIRIVLEEKKLKTVPVVLTFDGTLPEGISAGTARIEPKSIDIVAPLSVLKQTTVLRTEPITAANLAPGWKKGVPLDLETLALSLAPGEPKEVTVEFPAPGKEAPKADVRVKEAEKSTTQEPR